MDNRVYKELIDKIDIENACYGENKAKFIQTSNTPAITESLIKYLGFLSNNNAAKRILEGIY